MRFLVKMKMRDEMVPQEPDQLIAHMEGIIAQHEAILQLEASGKILASGMPVAKKADVFIADVGSNDELNGILMSLPHFPKMKVKVKPLTGFEVVDEIIGRNLARLKASAE